SGVSTAGTPARRMVARYLTAANNLQQKILSRLERRSHFERGERLGLRLRRSAAKQIRLREVVMRDRDIRRLAAERGAERADRRNRVLLALNRGQELRRLLERANRARRIARLLALRGQTHVDDEAVRVGLRHRGQLLRGRGLRNVDLPQGLPHRTEVAIEGFID